MQARGHPARAGLLHSVLTLLAGGVLAQALPLLLGPWLTRLYTPAEYGHYTLFMTVAANLAVVACARYDFALPLETDDKLALDLMALCVRVLLTVTLASALAAGLLVLFGAQSHWWWLPLAVASAGAAQWLTLWATRGQRFRSLAASRVTQYGGGAVLQVAAGVGAAAGTGSVGAGGVVAVGGAGVHGLVAGPVLAASAAAIVLAVPAPSGGWSALWRVPSERWRAAARRHRDFPLLNTPHAFAGALQDTLAVAMLVAITGEVEAGFWGLALRYLKAPASLVGGAVSQALYPRLVGVEPAQARAAVHQVMTTLALLALPLALVLLVFGPSMFALAFGEQWRGAGELARALAPYIGVHFIASPLAVVTLAWKAQAWALRLAIVGQVMFLAALALGLHWGGLIGGAWAVSAAMALYFGWYFWSLATWKNVPGENASDVRAA